MLPLHKKKRVQTPQRILLVRTDRIGDVVLTTPILKTLRISFPKAHIGFLTTPFTEGLIKGNPYIDEIITLTKKDKTLWGSLRFASKLKERHFDIAIVFNPKKRTHWLLFLARIPIRIGYHRKHGFLLTHSLPDLKYEGKQSEAFYNEELLTVLNIFPSNSTQLYLPISSETEQKIASFLKEHHLVSKSFAILSISASSPSKSWPLNNFIALCHEIHNELRLPIVIIGQDKACQTMNRSLKIPVVFLGETLPLIELSALIRQATFMITNDTGPMHMASAVNTPLVAIFGRSLPGLGPKRWGPISDNAIVLHKNIGCDPCLAHRCQLEFDCLKAIKISEVMDAAKSLSPYSHH